MEKRPKARSGEGGARSLVRVGCHGNRRTVDPRTVRRLGERILEAAAAPSSELSVLLCDDRFIRALNREFRHRDAATDVLSFAMREGEAAAFAPKLLGDVVISVETAARQAARDGKKPIDRARALLIHGILHLLGFDHETPGDKKQMRAEERRIAAGLRPRAR